VAPFGDDRSTRPLNAPLYGATSADYGNGNYAAQISQEPGARSQDQNCLVVAGSDILDRKSHEYVQTQVVQM